MIYGSIVITKIDAYNLTVVLVGAALSGAGKRARCLRDGHWENFIVAYKWLLAQPSAGFLLPDLLNFRVFAKSADPIGDHLHLMK